MQYDIKQYNRDQHDIFKALTVKQPYASLLLAKEHEEDNFAMKSIEVRSAKTSFKGDIMICSSKTPVIHGLESGVSIGLVELYDCKPCSKFTHEDWANTCIPEDERKQYYKHWGWFMKNPRRVIEFPVTGQLGIWTLIYTKGDISEYGNTIKFDIESLKLIRKDIKNARKK
jgi:hypothetical protein